MGLKIQLNVQSSEFNLKDYSLNSSLDQPQILRRWLRLEMIASQGHQGHHDLHSTLHESISLLCLCAYYLVQQFSENIVI